MALVRQRAHEVTWYKLLSYWRDDDRNAGLLPCPASPWSGISGDPAGPTVIVGHI